MAILRTATIMQSLDEIRQWDFDFNDDLPTGVTISSAVAEHTPPSGDVGTVVVGSPSAGVVPVKLTLAALVKGTHYLSCLATYSNGEKSEIKLAIPVDF